MVQIVFQSPISCGAAVLVSAAGTELSPLPPPLLHASNSMVAAIVKVDEIFFKCAISVIVVVGARQGLPCFYEMVVMTV